MCVFERERESEREKEREREEERGRKRERERERGFLLANLFERDLISIRDEQKNRTR